MVIEELSNGCMAVFLYWTAAVHRQNQVQVWGEIAYKIFCKGENMFSISTRHHLFYRTRRLHFCENMQPLISKKWEVVRSRICLILLFLATTCTAVKKGSIKYPLCKTEILISIWLLRFYQKESLHFSVKRRARLIVKKPPRMIGYEYPYSNLSAAYYKILTVEQKNLSWL